jgi:hypothetical protein
MPILLKRLVVGINRRLQTKEDFQVDFSRIDKMLEKWT